MAFGWAIAIKKRGVKITLKPQESFSSLEAVWEELLLNVFHPREENIFMEYHSFNGRNTEPVRVKVKIWKGGSRVLKTDETLNIKRARLGRTRRVEFERGLGLTRQKWRKLMKMREEYIRNYCNIGRAENRDLLLESPRDIRQIFSSGNDGTIFPTRNEIGNGNGEMDNIMRNVETLDINGNGGRLENETLLETNISAIIEEMEQHVDLLTYSVSHLLNRNARTELRSTGQVGEAAEYLFRSMDMINSGVNDDNLIVNEMMTALRLLRGEIQTLQYYNDGNGNLIELNSYLDTVEGQLNGFLNSLTPNTN